MTIDDPALVDEGVFELLLAIGTSHCVRGTWLCNSPGILIYKKDFMTFALQLLKPLYLPSLGRLIPLDIYDRQKISSESRHSSGEHTVAIEMVLVVYNNIPRTVYTHHTAVCVLPSSAKAPALDGGCVGIGKDGRAHGGCNVGA
ncbi:hypothetical protein GYMLUDRAFT_955049 [Collybiopsis luxurians FD-317 M1]|nr:hypothetical protein GYMLUDRAFT_955049 [Collybiopsis luxurians FD-317 M1]